MKNDGCYYYGRRGKCGTCGTCAPATIAAHMQTYEPAPVPALTEVAAPVLRDDVRAALSILGYVSPDADGWLLWGDYETSPVSE